MTSRVPYGGFVTETRVPQLQKEPGWNWGITLGKHDANRSEISNQELQSVSGIINDFCASRQ
jgi:hypothetical protein